ncbi:tetratricopeptide repeat protein, partial [Streptomyces sp. NPDC059037]|uniref:tetratricopeptide repeat protein n=1 Tax=Streptomyces sp. NPDC059037 TaxID=3346710 RepID=UPI0036AFCB9E
MFTGPDTALPALMAAATLTQQAQALTILARAAIGHANAGRTTISTEVLHAIDTALDTTPPAPQALQAVSAALPHPSRALASLALRLTHDLIKVYRELAALNPDHPDAFHPDLAGALNNLSIRYGELGRRAEALTASEEATAVYRRLAADNPDAYESDLAGSLNNLSVDYGAVGRRAEGLSAIVEATEIRRRLAAANPDAYEPDLAGALN